MRGAVVGTLAAALVLASCGQAQPAQKPMPEQPSMMAVEPVDFMADDGLTVSGTFYRATNPKALILLFHQAGSSKAEYATIAPRLVDAGYSALAIDQRSGGAMFGKNETAARMPAPASYGDALHDLDAALSWAATMNLPVIVWGSSYSAALVFELAAKRPKEIAALLAFSPGEYLRPTMTVADAAKRVRIPVFVTSTKDPLEITAAKAIFDAVPAADKVQAIPAVTGVHGSSTLIADRNPKGAEDNWRPVLKFLARVTS